jgi:hypothetical protein
MNKRSGGAPAERHRFCHLHFGPLEKAYALYNNWH